MPKRQTQRKSEAEALMQTQDELLKQLRLMINTGQASKAQEMIGETLQKNAEKVGRKRYTK